ncbi:MAG: GAF domain-containing protein, partial [Synechocystis sp.]|nr:GAF domain-containing protein [Synechocystis sp.]
MSFVSRYSEEIPTAIDWEPLSLSAELTVMEAIALWGDYFRQRSLGLCQGIAPVSWAVVCRENTLVGLLPDWQLAGALWGEQGTVTGTLADICLPVSQPLTLDELPSFSALISAFSQTSTTVLPIWNEKQQGWGLLSIGNMVRCLDLEQVWQRLPLHAVATPVSLLETPVTVGELGQRCCEHQLGAMPLIVPADSQAGRVQCLSLNDYLIQFPLHPQQRIEVDGMPPSPICRIGCSYSQARQVLQQQRGDYVVVSQCTGELHGWVTPYQWIEQLQPEALLTTLERDINENQRTKAALQTREDQLQTLINTIADGILIVDQGGTVIYANPVACQMFGSTPCQLLQSHLGVAIAPQNPTEITIVLPDQTSGIGELKSTTILWQGQPCSLIAIRDVTDRQRVLAQWQASEEEYRNLLETLPNLVWRLTATGEVEDCNQRTLDYLGQPKNQVLGTAWQRFIHPDELSLILEQWQDGLANGIFFELEYRLRRGDGAYRWQLLQMLPLPDSSGEIGYWLASNTDINSLKQAENQVRQQAQQEKLLANLGQRIRQSLNLEQILNNAVEEVRRTLQVDRVLVYQVYENGTGAAIAESVAEGYSSILAMTFAEEVFPPECYERYVNGYVYALTDRETGFVLDCLVDFLASIQVRAKLVVPLVFEEKLWGLLIAHQCSGPRIWKKYEVQLLQSLGNQLAIAIQQSLLY